MRNEPSSNINRVLLAIAAQIFLICATLLLFFVHIKIPMLSASAASLVVLAVGSILCWKSLLASKLILLLSLLGIEVVALSFEPELLLPSAAANVIVAVFLFVPRHWWE